jgi:hypothetical protein
MYPAASVESIVYRGEPASLVYLGDITEHKRSEEALRASRLQLSEAMDLAHIVYREFDPAANTYVFNDPFYAFYDTTAEQEGGYRMTREDYAQQFIHPDDPSLSYRSVKQSTVCCATSGNKIQLPILGLGGATRNEKAGLRHKSQQQEVHMLMDSVVVGITIGIFSFVSVIVVKLAAIAVHLTRKNRTRWQS